MSKYVVSDGETEAAVDLIERGGGSTEYGKTHSYQPIGEDLELEAGAGRSTESSFLAAIMGNVIGDALTKTNNYISGVIGALSVTGTKAALFQVGAVLGIVMNGVTDADGAVVAVIDGDDPSDATRANAAFAARMNNNHASSGVDYGVDLYDAGRAAAQMDSGLALPIAKADVRMQSKVCIITGTSAPTNGVTGANIAEKGSIHLNTSDGKLRTNTNTLASPTWTIVGSQS